ncbi:carbon-nitrogen hydrolase [Helicobacter sp. MIT 00-7814]|uniref:carbon-nitrogen hydrolase n=1 Tax=unclassified Helicobacter TaxID=2593540 RepID=UPI000E1F876E|nr:MULTISPECIES: carbon-nitrogen hydrolase [unclassified Helicobacter]RDU52068.1 carbon-nitrogen hydrolase [Helicobacter sp. MIT 00-7814]RDU52084.1 carbon-nitrogen hydrolase [Helicobacter sp. MIT 99-10781]
MLKVALIQQRYLDSKSATIAYTKGEILNAAKNGAKLVCLQELHTREYFCQSENPQFFDYALEFEEDIATFGKIAKEAGVVLVSSLFEKRASGLYHNTAVVFESDGSVAGKYRKMHIPDDPQFYEKFYFTPGDLGFEPIATSVGKLGVLICWDQWYPEAARIMALKGAEILIYPTAIGWFDEDSKEEKARQLDSWVAVQRGHSVANGLPLLCINRVGFEKDTSGVAKGIRFWGNSFAFGAQGELLAQASKEEAQTLFVDIDLSRSEEVRRMWPFLRDRRIESYKALLKRFCD